MLARSLNAHPYITRERAARFFPSAAQKFTDIYVIAARARAFDVCALPTASFMLLFSRLAHSYCIRFDFIIIESSVQCL